MELAKFSTSLLPWTTFVQLIALGMIPPAIWKGKSPLKGVVVFEPMASIEMHRAIMASCAAIVFYDFNDDLKLSAAQGIWDSSLLTTGYPGVGT